MDLSRILYIAIVAGSLCLTPQAQAAEWKGDGYFGWLGNGATLELEPGHFYFAGKFTGTVHYDDKNSPLQNTGMQCAGDSDKGGIGAGYCVQTDRDGDKIFSKWDCPTSAPIPKGAMDACSGKGTVTGGTGKFDGATGGYDLIGVTVMAHPDGTASGYSEVTNNTLTYKK